MRTRESVNNIVITEEDVMKTLNNLSQGKSVGPDNIHPKLLIECNEELCYPLTRF